MFNSSAVFTQFLNRHQQVDEIYNAMKNEDLSEVVMIALKLLKLSQQISPWSPCRKSVELSESYRNLGNSAFKVNDHKSTMKFYNEAICHAPKNSKQYKLAISNRSALLYKLKANQACLKDIETCFALGCPNEIIDKLKKRKTDILNSSATEDQMSAILNKSVDKYINCNMTRNPNVPCASKYVNITGDVTEKIEAACDIKAGTVVSSEKAYVSYTDILKCYLACYYCQKFALNLMPCDGCCFVMFCSDACKNQCNGEYHKYECKIMNIINNVCQDDSTMTNLMRKVALKIRSKCTSWAEFINESYKLGLNRLKNSSIEEIYNSNNTFSVLNTRDDRPFAHGILYNSCFVSATLVHHLDEIPSFYPKDPNEKLQAMRALGRIMMFIAIYQKPIHIYQAVTNLNNGKSDACDLQNYGIFIFTGNIKHSCKPNLFVMNKNNELVLLAMKNIKSGEELTISFQQHLFDADFNRKARNLNNFLFSGDVCNCLLCTGYKTLQIKGQLSPNEKKFYDSLNLEGIDRNLKCVHLADVYQKLLVALDILSDVPHSQEYREVFKRFRTCVIFYEAVKCGNFILDTPE